MIYFTVTPSVGGHRFFITQTVPTYDAASLSLYLPIWIPGSYTRRDFARFLSHLKATDQQGTELTVKMENPSRWQVEIPQGCQEIYLSYRVYARDLSVRGCYLDHQRGIFNPCCACLAVVGREDEAQRLAIDLTPPRSDWQICGLSPAEDGYYYFEDYHHLIDSPLMFGQKITTAQFKAGGVSHTIAITGAEDWEYERERLTADVAKICQAAIDLFGELPPAAKDYAFLLFTTGNVYGGLEHRNSTMLMSPRRLLPSKNGGKPYHQLLGLFSHEYFHTWNIKDLKPAIYQPYRLEAEQPSELLWLFEGFTAYFDNWLLVNSGVISKESYFNLLADDIALYLNRAGRKVQTLAQSSFEAWTKLYNGGEDGANISTTYYVHGSLHALCLDAFLQQATDQQLNLAKVMRTLWQDYHQTGEGMTEEKFIATVERLLPEAARADFRHFLHTYIHTTTPLPLYESLQYLGLTLESRPQNANYYTGFETQKTTIGYRVSALDENSSAAEQGLAVGDVIIAINHNQINEEIIERFFYTATEGKERTLHFFRDGLLEEIHFQLQPAEGNKKLITLQVDDNRAVKQEKWLQV